MAAMNNKEEQKSYRLKLTTRRLELATTSFETEAGSMLHGGIYNRELASSLAAGAVLVFAAIITVYLGIKPGFYEYLMAAILFVVLFLAFRVFVFFERRLVVTIDKAGGLVTVFIKGVVGKMKRVPIEELTGIKRGYTVIAPENLDGIRVVEKVALQHGTVIPGFGDLKEFHTVNLLFKDGRGITVFSSPDPKDTEEVLYAMKRFVGGETLA